ncbi:hypothetical protein PMAYCL1PPCAC_00992, partial [Pristionchus mayeri]
ASSMDILLHTRVVIGHLLSTSVWVKFCDRCAKATSHSRRRNSGLRASGAGLQRILKKRDRILDLIHSVEIQTLPNRRVVCCVRMSIAVDVVQ